MRQNTRLLTRDPASLDESEKIQLKESLARCAELNAVADCVRAFAEMMSDRCGSELEGWLNSAERTRPAPLRARARGLRQDFAAVTAGLTLECSVLPGFARAHGADVQGACSAASP